MREQSCLHLIHSHTTHGGCRDKPSSYRSRHPQGTQRCRRGATPSCGSAQAGSRRSAGWSHATAGEAALHTHPARCLQEAGDLHTSTGHVHGSGSPATARVTASRSRKGKRRKPGVGESCSLPNVGSAFTASHLSQHKGSAGNVQELTMLSKSASAALAGSARRGTTACTGCGPCTPRPGRGLQRPPPPLRPGESLTAEALSASSRSKDDRCSGPTQVLLRASKHPSVFEPGCLARAEDYSAAAVTLTCVQQLALWGFRGSHNREIIFTTLS